MKHENDKTWRQYVTKIQVGCADQASAAIAKPYGALIADLAAGGLHLGQSEWAPVANCFLRFETPWTGPYTVGEHRAIDPVIVEEIARRLKPVHDSVTITISETIAEAESPPPEPIAVTAKKTL